MAPALDVAAFSTASTQDFCFSSTCVEAAASLLSSMDMNIDPCSDFYQYTCGNWIKEAVIPEDLAVFGMLQVQSTHHKDHFRAILDGNYTDLLTATKSRSSFQVDTKEGIELDQLNFKVVQNYYASCLQVESTGKEALSSFYADLNQLTHETVQQSVNSTQFHLTAKAMEIISYPQSTEALVIDVGGLFTMEILPEENNRTKMTIHVYPPFEFDDDADVAPLASQGSDALFRLVSSLLGFQNSTDRDRERVSIILENTGLQMMNDAEIYSTVDSVISLQNRLHQLSQESQESNATSYSIKELSDAFTFVDWQSIIKANVPPGRNVSDLRVEIDNTNYFQKIEDGSRADDPTRTLHKDAILNYLILHKMSQDAPKLDSETRRLKPDLPFETRSQLCVDKVLENMNLVAGRFYSMFILNGESDRLKLGEMAESIKESLGSRIKKANWLDNTTRTSAMTKLDSMQKLIGYSISSPDQRSPKDIHGYLRGLKADSNNFYDNEKAVNQWTVQVYWDTIGRNVSPAEWLGVTSPQVENALILLSKNSIFVTAAFSQKPDYDAHYPDYLNYAGIGHTFGHEYSHAFDDVGSQYDEFGIERNWWSEKTKAEYLNKSQCFIDQYSKATIIDNGRQYSINGSFTLGENIADNEGLSATYDAYLKVKNSGKGYNPKLPGLQEFTAEALFFINAGRSFCSKQLPGISQDLVNDEHIPNTIRANKMFQNNEDFANVFNCPIGSKMNPERKCKIW